MTRITIQDLFNTLDKTRTSLLDASNDDGMVSRADLKCLLDVTQDPQEQRFIEFFYTFLIKIEDRPRMRVTEEIINQGIAVLKEQIIPNFEIQEAFSLSSQQKIAQVHDAALPLAMELIRTTSQKASLSAREVSEQIAQLSEGLYFDDYGSEAAIAVDPFFLEHPQEALSPTSFAQALGIDPNTPKGKIERFDPADRVLQNFIERQFNAGLSERARTVVELMQANLDTLSIIVVGQDNHPDLESNHPVYVFGMGPDGNLAGFTSFVIWT